MKKITLMLSFLLLVSLLLGKNDLNKEFNVNLGIPVSKFDCKDSEEVGPVFGLSFGSSIIVPINKYFSIKPGVQYIQKGTSRASMEYEYFYHLNYFEIPILTEFQFSKNYYFFGGLYLSFLIDAKVDIDYKDNITTEDVTDDFSGTDQGLILGIKGKVSNNFDAEVRYEKGLQDIFEDNYEFKNQTLFFLISFRLKKF